MSWTKDHLILSITPFTKAISAVKFVAHQAFKRLDDEEGRIALCTLGSINWGAFRHPEDMRRACRVLQRSLCNILDYQDFLSIQSQLSNDEIQPLGYWYYKSGLLARQTWLEYGEKDALAEVKSWMEHQAYYLTEATVELAKERGRCKDSDKTRYGKGIFPWERRAKGVNELTDFTPDPAWIGIPCVATCEHMVCAMPP
jgi:ribonucleoside-diphosphate reductase alpha chain